MHSFSKTLKTTLAILVGLFLITNQAMAVSKKVKKTKTKTTTEETETTTEGKKAKTEKSVDPSLDEGTPAPAPNAEKESAGEPSSGGGW